VALAIVFLTLKWRQESNFYPASSRFPDFTMRLIIFYIEKKCRETINNIIIIASVVTNFRPISAPIRGS